MKQSMTGTWTVLATLIAIVYTSASCTQANLAKSHKGSQVEQPARTSNGVQPQANQPSVADAKPTPARKVKADVCAKPTVLSYAKLSDFIGDHTKRRNGECMVVTDVPVFSEVRNAEDEYGNHKGQYYLIVADNTEVGNTFVSSSELAKGVAPHLKQQVAALRVTAVRIQFSDEIEVFWSPYAVKVEGLDEDGEVLWTVSGKPPGKLKFPV